MYSIQYRSIFISLFQVLVLFSLQNCYAYWRELKPKRKVKIKIIILPLEHTHTHKLFCALKQNDVSKINISVCVLITYLDCLPIPNIYYTQNLMISYQKF